jgi:hypothetical protein
MRFTLFRDFTFEVKDPEALIEAYCFQSDFYEHYDFLLRQGNRSLEDVRFIGARIRKSALDNCKAIIDSYKDFRMFGLNLDSFLRETPEARNDLAFTLAELARKLDAEEGVGFSKATKILHTRYPAIIPMIDNPLQREYRKIKPKWKKGDWGQLFKDYYENFFVKETYDNLCKIHRSLLSLDLTKIRIFDILWWSCLKAKTLKESKHINWTTIEVGP